MTAEALAAAGIVVLALFVLTTLRATNALTKRVRELEATVQAFRAEHARTGGELDRVDVLLDRADKISARVDSTSRFAYNTLATPVIKAFAVGRGTSEAARSLRHRNGKS